MTDRYLNQWVELLDVSDACLVRPETCGPEGASLTVWIKVLDYSFSYGIISSVGHSPDTTGILVRDHHIWMG